MNQFCTSSGAEKLPRVQELTTAIAEFVARDLRPVSPIDSEGFLHLMEVAEPQYVVTCHRTVDSCLDKMYCAVKAQVQQGTQTV